MKIEGKKRFETVIKFEKYDNYTHPQITKAQCLIAYHGENRNSSNISKETFENSIPSLANIPVVGQYWEKSENFKAHGGKIEITDDGIEYIVTTQPYGMVGENPNAKWVEVEEANGDKREYLACDVYLWTGRYPELTTVKENGSRQSMEIMVSEGELDEETGIYNINKFDFDALCILGKDEENDEFNFEPCFESSSIVAYALNEDEYSKQLKVLYSFISDFNTQEEDEEEVVKDEEEKEEVFSITYNDKRTLLSQSMATKEETDIAGDWVSSTYYYLMDFDDEYAYFEKCFYNGEVDTCTCVQIAYSINAETRVVEFSGEEIELFHAWLTKEEMTQVGKMELKVSELQGEIETINSELNDLRAYKLGKEQVEYELELNEFFSKFDETLKDNDEFKALKVKALEEKFEISKVENEIFIILGKIAYKFNKVEKVVQSAKIFSHDEVKIDEENIDKSNKLERGYYDEFKKK